MEISIHLNDNQPHFKAEGRNADINNFEGHIKFWSRQLESTAVINDPEEWSLQTKYEKPKFSEEIKKRLMILTNEKMNDCEIWEHCQGPLSSRETRMAIVGRIAIMNFDCRVTGGFIRDWIINGETPKTNLPLDQWVQKTNPLTSFQTYDIAEGILPKDLDIELPPGKYFDVSRFINDVRMTGITVVFHEHIAQRHIFLF